MALPLRLAANHRTTLRQPVPQSLYSWQARITNSFYHQISLYTFAFCFCQWTNPSRNPLERVIGGTSL